MAPSMSPPLSSPRRIEQRKSRGSSSDCCPAHLRTAPPQASRFPSGVRARWPADDLLSVPAHGRSPHALFAFGRDLGSAGEGPHLTSGLADCRPGGKTGPRTRAYGVLFVPAGLRLRVRRLSRAATPGAFPPSAALPPEVFRSRDTSTARRGVFSPAPRSRSSSAVSYRGRIFARTTG